jgi:LPS sulfotransferase NodH
MKTLADTSVVPSTADPNAGDAYVGRPFTGRRDHGIGGWSIRLKRQALDLGLYGQSDYTPFIILGRSRVGSNLLRTLLNAHPQIAAYGEVFRDAQSFDWDHFGYFQSRGMRSLMRNDPVRFVDARILGRYPSLYRAVGFKLFYYHARDGAAASVWPYLQNRPDLRVIHLKRRNLLQTHLSRKRAALSGRWVNTSGRPNGSSQPQAIRLDYQECLDDFVETRTREEEGDRYFTAHPKLEVVYETLSADYRNEAGRVHEFLGVDARPADPATFRQRREPLAALIANYDELKEQFSGTVWQEFFAE